MRSRFGRIYNNSSTRLPGSRIEEVGMSCASAEYTRSACASSTRDKEET